MKQKREREIIYDAYGDKDLKKTGVKVEGEGFFKKEEGKERKYLKDHD